VSEKDALMIIRPFVSAIARDDREAYKTFLTSDIVFVHRPSGNTIRGFDAVSASFTKWRREFSELSIEILDAFASQNRAVAQLRWKGRHGSKNLNVDFIGCWVLSIRDEKLCEIVDFYDKGTYQQQIDRAV